MNVSTSGLHLTPDSPVDLHLHTTFSDGRWTPEALLDYLLREQFSLAAITDHDRMDTFAGLQQLALEKHLPVLAAVEMGSTWKGAMTDLLCFAFDPGHSALDVLTQDLLRRQQENTREVYENLERQGYAFPPGTLAEILSMPAAQHPPAWFALIKEYGSRDGEFSAGEILMESGCAYELNDPAAIVEAAHRDGGVCLLAHPGRANEYLTYDVELLDELRGEVPIDGLEVYYPLHTAAQTGMYAEYARRHHLLSSAGSDSHGPDKSPIQYRAELVRDFLERAGIRL